MKSEESAHQLCQEYLLLEEGSCGGKSGRRKWSNYLNRGYYF